MLCKYVHFCDYGVIGVQIVDGISLSSTQGVLELGRRVWASGTICWRPGQQNSSHPERMDLFCGLDTLTRVSGNPQTVTDNWHVLVEAVY